MGAEVHAGGTHFTALAMIPRAMRRFFEELNKNIEEVNQRDIPNPFCLAAWACADFVVIYPFLDYDGHTGRMLLNAITMRYAGITDLMDEYDVGRSRYLDIKRRCSGGMMLRQNVITTFLTQPFDSAEMEAQSDHASRRHYAHNCQVGERRIGTSARCLSFLRYLHLYRL